MGPVTLVGAPQWDPEDFAHYLRETDPCFGSHARTANACKDCIAPVIMDGKLLLMRDLCAAETHGTTPGRIHRMTSAQVLERLRSGASVEDVFREILGDADPDLMGAVARNLLAARVRYLREKGLGDLLPDVPLTAELK